MHIVWNCWLIYFVSSLQSIAEFFNQSMAAVGGNTGGPGDVVLNVSINQELRFAYVEMRLVEEASNAMALDGILFEGVPLAIRRPADYNPSQAASMGPSMPNPHMNLAAVGLTEASAQGLEGPGRIYIAGFPDYITESQLRELLESFGHLRGFDFVKDWQTGNPMGYAFCIYQDLTVTDIACATLNGTRLGSTTLTVRQANQPQSDMESILRQAQQQAHLQAQLNYVIVTLHLFTPFCANCISLGF
jgi:splicing factor U2AF subunit